MNLPSAAIFVFVRFNIDVALVVTHLEFGLKERYGPLNPRKNLNLAFLGH